MCPTDLFGNPGLQIHPLSRTGFLPRGLADPFAVELRWDFYKLNNDTRLGQPSLLPTTEDDKNRSFVIHSFDIEELPQSQGCTAGIAVVEDFS